LTLRPLRTLRFSYVTRESRQVLLELPAEDLVDTNRSQPLGIERRVEPEGGYRRRRIDATGLGDHGRRESRRRMHRKMESDQSGAAKQLEAQLLFRRVDAHHVPPAGAKPRRGGGETEWLAPHFIGADEDTAHGETIIVSFGPC